MRIEFWMFDFSPRLRDPLTRGFLVGRTILGPPVERSSLEG